MPTGPEKRRRPVFTCRARRDFRVGLTLLEVLLALAILGGALVVIGELMRLGARNAEQARDLSTAQILCETKVNEIVAGLLPAQVVTQVPVEGVETLNSPGEWLYSVAIDQVDQNGLIAVWVTVHQSPQAVARPVSFTLARWMTDPTVAAMEASEEAATTGGASGDL